MCRICHTLISHWPKNLGYVGFEFMLQLTFGKKSRLRWVWVYVANYVWCLNCLIRQDKVFQTCSWNAAPNSFLTFTLKIRDPWITELELWRLNVMVSTIAAASRDQCAVNICEVVIRVFNAGNTRKCFVLDLQKEWPYFCLVHIKSLPEQNETCVCRFDGCCEDSDSKSQVGICNVGKTILCSKFQLRSATKSFPRTKHQMERS